MFLISNSPIEFVGNLKELVFTQRISFGVSLTALSTEEELLSHVKQTYSEAVTGQKDICLCAQAIVSTIRHFYRHETDPKVREGTHWHMDYSHVRQPLR